MQVAFDNGTIQATRWQTDGIVLNHQVINYHRFENQHTVHPEEMVRLHFGLKGDCKVRFNHLDKAFDLKAGQHNIIYSQGLDIEVYNQTKHIETFGVNIPVQLFVKYAQDGNEALKRFCDKVMTGTNSFMAEQWRLPNLAIRKVIDEVIHSSFDGGLQKLFLLSKSIELLVLQAQQLGSPKDMHKRVIKTKADQHKMAEARHIMETRYQSPPTLSELAKEIGMNECKLKQGFKEVFDTTVFGYLSYLRLKLARRMLQDTQQTAKEIAYELGYSSPQHFNNAFKKAFGVTPAFVRQTS